ncbi:MAG: magnesium/cobalt transporter CorA [Candidatus Freyarchaeota archaeon]|nr:magnesium/cobalt transporter CorA [Candidatus Jordarchaeia archaeon]MBS7267219.1 magnesium/cobalt transporter CorA [Candidatus Jordarchaeia archaeon]MBS7278457.1 magnesium/cobalt transporter CorA [Candidatus Jordarchaeia archaeon]
MVGLPPGTPVYIGEKVAGEVKIRVMDYDETHFQEKEVKAIEECFPFKDTPTVTWINIDGVHQAEIIEKIGKQFDIHPLILEDIMNTEQRPKIEDFENYLFIVLKMLYTDNKNGEIQSEQVSLVVGPNYVISFQEKEGDVFDPIRDRIRTAKGRVRRMGPDYLAYALIDAIVDNYFVVLEKVGEKIEDVEEKLVTEPSPQVLKNIHGLKRKLLFLRKSVWPLREVINILERGECSLVKKATIIFLRDVYDHTIQVIETIEIYREMLSEMIDAYLSSISNKTNEIVKVLTIIATIFIPLTFIASIYGMNFTWMPEIEWPEGYHMVLVVMAIIGSIMIIFFRRKKWI